MTQLSLEDELANIIKSRILTNYGGAVGVTLGPDSNLARVLDEVISPNTFDDLTVKDLYGPELADGKRYLPEEALRMDFINFAYLHGDHYESEYAHESGITNRNMNTFLRNAALHVQHRNGRSRSTANLAKITLGDIVQLPRAELLEIDGIGVKTHGEMNHYLQTNYGLSAGTD